MRDPLNSTSTLYLYIERTPEVVHDVKRLVGSLLKQLMDLRTTVSPFINDAWTRLQKSSPSEEVIKSLFAVSKCSPKQALSDGPKPFLPPLTNSHGSRKK